LQAGSQNAWYYTENELKAKHYLSNKVFEGMLKIVKDKLSEKNELPPTTYEAKQIVCPLGLEIQNIHVCPNDCILYRGNDYENLDVCPVQNSTL
jgi:hypothetical protein